MNDAPQALVPRNGNDEVEVALPAINGRQPAPSLSQPEAEDPLPDALNSNAELTSLAKKSPLKCLE
jgi:hypothetical protein